MDFTWDKTKASSNFTKHEVSFAEAITVFADPLAAIFDDPDHSEVELRELIVGHSIRDRLLIVSFTERDDLIRLISARKTTRYERRAYENRPTPG
jgi:uncharacterized DUF497 family protein